jgi:hypothetical protein
MTDYMMVLNDQRLQQVILVFAIFLSTSVLSSATPIRLESGPQQTALVELYTSEGCSSCPPAEAWMTRLKDNPGLWKQFVPAAFHVDYWDRLGWRDRFSSKQWTERQGRYAALWQSESVYTPAVVVNGREERGWSAANLSRPNEKQTGTLSATTSEGKNFSIEFRPEKGSGNDWEAHLALLGSGLSSQVKAGENSGRRLEHDFVVLELQNAEMKFEAGLQRARLTTEASIEAGARKAVAVWITRRGELAPVQATGGWLP